MNTGKGFVADTKQLTWLWWGENANQEDKGVWETFQRDMKMLYTDASFIECISKDDFDREYQRLTTDGWTTTGRFGSGMWQRIMGWSRPRTDGASPPTP
jgi:hypothetical protein